MMDGGTRDKFERNWEKCRKSFLIWPTFDRSFDLQMGGSFISFNFMYFFMMKVQLFKTIVRSVLMYGCEAWKLTKKRSKAGWFPIQVHEEDFKNKVASDHLPPANSGEHRSDQNER